jgi:hypothetical protein
MASILHQEGAFRGRVSGRPYVWENIWDSSIGLIEGQVMNVRETGGTVVSYFAEQQFNSSEGVAQLRPSTMREIISGGIPAPQNNTIGFDTTRLRTIQQQYLDILQARFFEGAPTLISGMPSLGIQGFSEEAQLFARDEMFLSNELVSLELLAANLYRGILRVKSRYLEPSQPTVFNLAAWHNAGLQGGEYSAYSPKAQNYANDVLGHMVQFVEGECDLGFGSRPVPWRDFLYYNAFDEPYLSPNWGGTPRE